MHLKNIRLLLLPIIIVITLISVESARDFGCGSFGAGNFGTNTIPIIEAYQPNSSTYNIDEITKVTFNVTFVDYDDCDNTTIDWSINGTFNASNKNLSFVFSDTGVYNITANVSDNMSNVYQTWIVNVSIPLVPIPPAPAVGGPTAGTGSAINQIYTQNQTANVTTELLMCKDEIFIERLFSECKIADNGVCDDGESVFDVDCGITDVNTSVRTIIDQIQDGTLWGYIQDGIFHITSGRVMNDINSWELVKSLRSGKIMGYMWFLRFFIMIALFMLALNNKSFPYIVVFIMVLLVYNRAFVKEGVEIIQTNCMDVNFIIHLGYCTFPSNQIIGWAIWCILIGILAWQQVAKKRKKQKPKAKPKQKPQTI